ncbi:MAG: hypothetical protein ABIN92_01255 [Ferruginibacter sp.]
MKKILLMGSLLVSFIGLVAQNVGIGTTLPKAAFNIADGRTVLFGSDTSGFGMKFIWYPQKGALRAGYAFGSAGYDFDNSWDLVNVGTFSTAFGTATIARGNASVAMGEGTIAGSTNSVAMGRYNIDVPNAYLMIGNGYDDFGTTVRSNILTVLNNGRVGIGTVSPMQALDIGHGRLRFSGSYAGAPSGIEFTDLTGSTVLGLVGMKDDNTLGIKGNIPGWSFNHNMITGNTGFGAEAGTSKVTINGGSDNALEIDGGIKVSGNNKPAFQLTVNAANALFWGNIYTDKAYGFTIDNALCNNDPNALIFITAVGGERTKIFSVMYNAGSGKWQCIASETGGEVYLDYWEVNLPGGVTSFINDFQGKTAILFHTGDKFNILIIKQ